MDYSMQTNTIVSQAENTVTRTSRNRPRDHSNANSAGPGSAMRYRRLFVMALSIVVCIAFIAAAFGLVEGLLTGNLETVGLVFWILPRLGFIALVVLLFRFVTLSENNF